MVFIFITIAAIGIGIGTATATDIDIDIVILTIVRISDFIDKWWDMKSCHGMQSSAFIICYIKYQSIVVVVIVVAIPSGFGDEHVANTT